MKFLKQQKNYESDHTRFIAQLKEKNPGMAERQREGRSLLWDQAPLTLDEQRRRAESRVPQQPYVYQTSH
jgi:hypothetical protein